MALQVISKVDKERFTYPTFQFLLFNEGDCTTVG